VICAWGIDENGHRALVSVRLGAREAKEDWLELGRDLISRGLQRHASSWPTGRLG
jgi:transposase-like protein